LNVYALAALAILNPNWAALQANVAKKLQPKEEDQQPQQIQEEKQPFVKPNRPQKARGSWAKTW
jgi:phage terminase large subunit GpA-like protein